MITLTDNVKAGLDGNYAMTWIYRVTLDSGVKYWSSIPLEIGVLSMVGTVPMFGGLSGIETSCDVYDGGNIGAVGNCSLSLNELAVSGGLHQNYLPQTGGNSDELYNRLVEVGIVWGSPYPVYITDITWLYSGVIDNFTSTRPTFEIELIGSREVEQRMLPKTCITGDNYPNAPKEAVGSPLPILYGDFYTENDPSWPWDSAYAKVWRRYPAAPCYCVDRYSNIFTFAGHTTYSDTANRLLYRTSGMGQYANVYVYNDASHLTPTFNHNDSGISTIVISLGIILGDYAAVGVNAGSYNIAPLFKDAIDNSADTYVYLDSATPSESMVMVTFGDLPSGEPYNTSIFPVRWMFHLLSSHAISEVYALADGTDIPTSSGIYTARAGMNISALALTGITDVSQMANYQFGLYNVSDIAQVGTICCFFSFIIAGKFNKTPQFTRVNGRRSSGTVRER